MEVVFVGLWMCSSRLLMLTCSTTPGESGKKSLGAKKPFLKRCCLLLPTNYSINYPIHTTAVEIESQALLDRFTC